jgi:ornithine carbamoyltransferase
MMVQLRPKEIKMTVNLKGRSFVKELDFTPDELTYLLTLAKDLKAAKREGRERQRLKGRNIALIFEKDSTRTRCAFEVAAYDQGAHPTYLGPSGSQIGGKETIKDTARVLGRMYDAIEYRGFGQDIVETLATYSGVPVYNGLTNEFHPTQLLADVLTMMEHCDKPLDEVAYCYLGDARFNMGNSMIVMGSLMGMDVRICAPRSLWPNEALLDECRRIAATTDARLTLTEDVDSSVKGVDFIHTDVWVSMGESEAAWAARIPLLRPYQVNADLIARTGNPDVKFMHCLPAFHDGGTKAGRQVIETFGFGADGMEVTDDIFESARSIVFDQAENRMHTIKAIMVATLADG